MHGYQHPAKVYAERYDRSPRTIHEWAKRKAPLDNEQAMEAFMRELREARSGNLDLSSVKLPEISEAVLHGVKLGVPEALKALGEAEARLRLQVVESEAGGDQTVIGVAYARWIKIADSLRRYDTAVAMDRRDSGQMVPKAEAEEAVRSSAVWIRQAVQRLASKLTPLYSNQGAAEQDVYVELMALLSTFTAEALVQSQRSVTPVQDWARKIISQSLGIEKTVYHFEENQT
jgi:hypothetical protein